jgi:hypothetical protein
MPEPKVDLHLSLDRHLLHQSLLPVAVAEREIVVLADQVGQVVVAVGLVHMRAALVTHHPQHLVKETMVAHRRRVL